jgi:glycosyltransferase involved in cell wall biosynthesis
MVSESGVEYRSATKTHEYFHQYEPKLHIAWRHPTRLTRAPSVVWCHDLVTPGAENINANDHLLCLSEFHKNYVQSMQGIPDEKIIVTRNGLSPEKFMNLSFEKKHAKVIWPNSPDRGLDHAILIMDKVREMESEAELHIFYGMDNMFKYGMGDQANALKKMIAERPWVKYHGNVDQRTLVKEFASSQVWLYPATFIETYCISAQEALAAKAYPVCREIGALQDTMRAAAQKGWADLLDVEPVEVDIWAKHVVDAIREEKWKRIELQPETISWRALAKDWVKMFGL